MGTGSLVLLTWVSAGRRCRSGPPRAARELHSKPFTRLAAKQWSPGTWVTLLRVPWDARGGGLTANEGGWQSPWVLRCLPVR